MGRGYGRKNSIVTRAKENLAAKFRDVMSHFGTKNPIRRDVHSRIDVRTSCSDFSE